MGKKILCPKREASPPKNLWLQSAALPPCCHRGTRQTRPRKWVLRRKYRTRRKAAHWTTRNSNEHYSNRSFWRKIRRPLSRRRERPAGYPVSSPTWVTAWYVSVTARNDPPRRSNVGCSTEVVIDIIFFFYLVFNIIMIYYALFHYINDEGFQIFTK